MELVSVSDARAALPQLLDRVQDGEEVLITRHGKPVAVLMRPDAVRARRAESVIEKAGRMRELLDEARSAPLPTDEGLTPARAESLIRAIRTARDSR